MYVYVIDKEGRPLMPTARYGKVRRLLRDGLAVVVSHTPFTIKLTYETTRFTQPVSLGVDAGSKHVGLSATTARKELYAAEIELRTDIVGNLSARREARHTRRSRLRHRAPRFDNRRRPEGWLAPSTAQKVHSHVRAVRDACRFLPVSYITVEVAQFDMQRIKNPDISGTGYQHGPQEGFWNVREYVLWRDGHRCRHCHGKSGDPVLNVHHLESRKTGGNSPDNLVTLCGTCHRAYHAGGTELNLGRSFASLRDAAAMNVMRWSVFHGLRQAVDVPVFYTYGYITKYNRIQAGLVKSHAVDARCISGNFAAEPLGDLCVLMQVRRHNRKVMKENMLKGGRWKRNQAPREIKGFRLWDIVTFNNAPAYVHARRSTGYFVVKDPEGKTLSDSVSWKALRLKKHTGPYIFHLKKRTQGPIPPTNEFVGFLGHLS